MTLNELAERLRLVEGDLPLVFTTQDGDIGPGYHVTEFKHARISGIDCGGRTSDWTEAAFQLLDGGGGEHMSVGRFSGILATSLDRLSGLGDAPVHVEFSHDNIGLETFGVGAPEVVDGRVSLPLERTRAVCKPMQSAMSFGGAGDCCSAKPSAQACCG